MSDLREIERVMKALANKRRLAVIRYLKISGRTQAGDLAREIRISFPAMSRHLSMLESAGILEREQIGLIVFYRLSSRPHTCVKEVISLC